MTGPRARTAAAIALAAGAVGVGTPSAQAAWSSRTWLLAPSAAAVARLGPVWADDTGQAFAAVQGDPVAGGPADWRLVRQRVGGSWSDDESLGVPAGLTPMAVGEDGTLVAAGVVATPAGPEVYASRRRDGAWEAPRALSAPLAGESPTLSAVVGPDGTAAVSWVAAGVAHVSLIADDRLVPLAAPGTGTPIVRLAESGAAMALWTRAVAGGQSVAFAVRPARGGWSAPGWAPVARPVPAAALSFDADVAGTGQAVLVWTAGAAGANRIWSSVWIGPRDRWTAPAAVEPAVIPGARVEAVRATVAGDAVAVWSTTTRTETATRLAGNGWWSRDGSVVGAPGRGRAARAPVQVVAARAGGLTVGWALHDGLAAAVRGPGAGSWPPADTHTAVIGPLGVRMGGGRGGDVVAAWAVTAGVASGRVGVAVREGSGGPALTGLSMSSARTGPVAHIGLTTPGRVTLEVHRQGTGVLVATTLVDLPAGLSVLPLPGELRARLARGDGYVLRARTSSRDPGAATASAAFTTRR